jgi:peptide/nickel transport system substrate-binding protein
MLTGSGRRVLVVALASSLLLSPVAANAVASSEDPRVGGTAVIGAEQEPPCLNVLLASCNVPWASWTAGIAVPGAFRVTPKFSYEPMLVERVDAATNPFTLTYHIREEAVWSDGTPVSADDFIFTLAATLESRNDVAPHLRQGYDLIAQTVKVDEKTAKFVFARPYGAWRTLFPSIFPKHVLEGTDFNQVWQTEIADPVTHEPIGSGPFLVADWVRGQYIRMSRNPRWWGRHAPFLDAIVVRFILDTNSRFQALVDGQVQLLAPEPALQIAELRGRPEIAVETSPGTAMEHLDFNTAHPGHPLLRERWFRQAVAFAFDREALFPLLYGSISPDFGAHHNLNYPRTHENYVRSFARYAFSPETAEDIMRRHGCVKGGDGIYSCGGIRASVRFSTTTGNTGRAQAFDAIQQQLKSVGIELVPRFQTGGTLFGTTLPSSDWDLIMFTYLQVPTSKITSKDLYACRGDQNYGLMCDSKLTRILNRVPSVVNDQRREALLQQADKRIAATIPSIPMFARPSFFITRRNVTGPQLNLTLEGSTWNASVWQAG